VARFVPLDPLPLSLGRAGVPGSAARTCGHGLSSSFSVIFSIGRLSEPTDEGFPPGWLHASRESCRNCSNNQFTVRLRTSDVK
jgi:hypothetical protein